MLKYSEQIMINFIFSKKTGFIFIILLFLIAGFFLYYNYFRPVYNLADFIPQNAVFAWQFSNSKATFNTTTSLPKNIPQEFSAQLNSAQSLATKLFPQATNYLDQNEEAVLFWLNDQQFGLLIKLTAEPNAKQTDYTALLQKNIILFLNDQSLTEQIKGHKPSNSFQRYLLTDTAAKQTLSFNAGFFQTTWSDFAALQLWQKILSPLTKQTTGNYFLNIENKDNFISFTVAPQNLIATEDQKNSLEKLLILLPDNLDLVFGLKDVGSWQQALNNDANLQSLWQQGVNAPAAFKRPGADILLKNLHGGAAFGLKNNSWFLITSEDNLEAVKTYLQNYSAGIFPREKGKTLPDGSYAIELLSDPNKVTFKEQSNGDAKQLLPEPIIDNLGIIVKDHLVTASNALNTPQNTNQTTDNCLKPSSVQKNRALTEYFVVNKSLLQTEAQKTLNAFSKIIGGSFNDGVTRLCLYF